MRVSIGNEAEAARLKPASTQQMGDELFILGEAFARSAPSGSCVPKRRGQLVRER
jgi:hypothetical protein